MPTPAFAAGLPPTPPQEILQDKVTRIAAEHNISADTLSNLVDSESSWDPAIKGDKGCSWGLVQINICAHPEITKKEATDPEFALDYAADAIQAGTESDDWTSCNCYSLVWTRVRNLPHMADIITNTNVPHKGQVAIFYYHEKGTGKIIKHIAYVLSVAGGDITLLEANKTHCLIDTRVIHLSDPYLVGFWDPAAV